MKAKRTTSRTVHVLWRGGFAGLALGVSLLGAGPVLAEGGPGLPALVPDPATEPAAPPAGPHHRDPQPPMTPAAEAGPAPIPVADAPGPAADEPAPPPATPGDDPSSPGNLFPEDEGPAPNVSNVSLTGEAYTVRQDLKAPLEVHLGRYPRATTEVSADLTTAFGAFADPGFLGRFAANDGLKSAGSGEVGAPAWTECVFPKSPLTPQEDVRSPGQGAGPTAVARCYQGAGQAAGYYARDPGPDKTAGVPVFRAGAAAAAVDATSNPAGATATSSFSTLEDVNVAQQVVIRSLTNEVTVRTNGRPGGAVVETAATITGLRIAGIPVELPSDSLEKLGPTLAQLPPVLTPLGVLTFDVVPEQKEAAADGTAA
ncbi:MAG TPA: hypothetical protein VI854_09800, partial [Acidimicrobiia bacterium]|nr:hypothetical protein [Acidimicrobiia bacterium]